LSDLIEAACWHIEKATGQQFISATWSQTYDRFPETFVLRVAPVTAVDSIKYTDTAGVQQTLSASVYLKDMNSVPARIMPAYGQYWPDCREQLGSVICNFTAGYATAAAAPPIFKHAVKLWVNNAFKNPEAVKDDYEALKLSMDDMLYPYVVREWQ
jgi:uncharacterized phiE125 gp8 family phage protein